ncbi:acyltransferase [Ruminococcaceae bacterium OttesenSCG-928-I18]|nr:acyltransferase [Ruminococcaceae bacterium OttesenSCG-928-I18]
MVKRERWIDYTKGLAMIAVVVDHYPYRNPMLQPVMYFSVVLFFLMAGYNSYSSLERRQPEHYDWGYTGKHCWKLAKPYLLASAVVVLYAHGVLDLGTYGRAVLTFSASAPFYFVLIFLQMILVSQLLYFMIKRSKAGAHPLLLQGAMLLLLLVVVWFTQQYTHLFDLHGTAKNLLGGFYLLMFFIGMLWNADHLQKRSPILPACIAAVVFLACLYFILQQQELFGMGPLSKSPPKLTLPLYGLAVFMLCATLLPRLEKKGGRVLFTILSPLEWCGKYSLQIFLYHLLFIDLISLYVLEPLFALSLVSGTPWLSLLVRLAGLLLSIALPVVFTFLYRYGKGKLVQWWKSPGTA